MVAPRARLSASQEDYLEAIYHIIASKQAARAKDISERLGVNNSSVTGALHALAGKGLINYEPYDIVTLTSQGRGVAREVVRRHEVLRDFLIGVLEVAPEEAEESACKLEHAVSDVVLERLVHFMENVPQFRPADDRPVAPGRES